VLQLRHFTWALLTASLVVGLAALVRIADPRVSGADDITGVIRLPWLVTWTIIALFSLAALVLVVDVVRRMRSRRHGEDEEGLPGREEAPRPPWLVALTQILSLLNFIVIVYLLWKNVLPFTDLMALGAGFGSAIALPQERPVDAPFFITWTFAVFALVGGAGALALALWLTSSDRLAKWWEGEADDPAPPPFVEAVDESLEDLRAEPDARRAIIRCYARFQRAAAASGLERRPWHTPMEFMREALSRLPAPREAVRALTGLFELARFSDRALGPAERDRALDALDDIKAAIDTGRADAVAH
jgi:Domain of unknown function (DUF4129)